VTALDLDAIRGRADRYEEAIKRESATWFAPAARSADDVPALIAEVERLRARRGYASQRLDKAREAAEALLRKEQKHAGSGRDGHLSEDDLVPLFEALGAIYLDDPNLQILVDSDGDPQ
jgi:hypothetical protein